MEAGRSVRGQLPLLRGEQEVRAGHQTGGSVVALSDTWQSPGTARHLALGCRVSAQPFIEIEHLGGGGQMAARKRMSSLLAS